MIPIELKRRYRACLLVVLVAQMIHIPVQARQPVVGWAGTASLAKQPEPIVQTRPPQEAEGETTRLNKELERLLRSGQFDEALKVAEQGLSLSERKFGKNHSHVATWLNNIAFLSVKKGDYAKAEPLYQSALKIYEIALGPNDINVARTLGNLAILYGFQGRYSEAEAFLERAISISESVLGVDHPDVDEWRTIREDHKQKSAQSASDRPRLMLQLGHSDRVNSIAFSPDGKYALTASTDKTAKLWHVDTGHEIRSFVGHTDYVHSIAFSPDGRYVLTGSADGSAQLWDVKTGRVVRTFVGQTAYVLSVGFSPDGNYVVIGTSDATIRVLDAKTAREIRAFVDPSPPGISARSYPVAFSPDGKYVVGGFVKARLWNIETGLEVRSFEEPLSDYVWSVAFSGDGKYLLTGGADRVARLWDVATGTKVKTFAEGSFEESFYISSVAFSPDGRYVMTGGQNRVLIWDRETGHEVSRFGGKLRDVKSVAFSPDGKYGLIGSNSTTLWELSTGREIHRFEGRQTSARSAVFSSDGRHLLTAGGLWDLDAGRELRRFKMESDSIQSVAFSPDDKYVLTGGLEKKARLWEVATGQIVKTFEKKSSFIHSVAFSPDGKYVLGGGGAEAWLWEIETGQVRTFGGHESGEITSVAFSKDGKYLATGGLDSTARLWEVGTGRKIQTFQAYMIYSVAFSPDGRYLATGSRDSVVRLWDVKTGTEFRRFAGNQQDVYSIAFSPDGKYLATGNDFNVAHLWDVASGRRLSALVGHLGSIKSIAFSPDGKRVVTGSSDGTARLWDVSSGKELCQLVSLSLGDWAIVTPDGRFDTNNLEEIKGLHWIMPDDPMRTLSPEVFMRDYYEPQLLPRLLRCNADDSCEPEFKPLPNLAELNRVQPKIANDGIRIIHKPGAGDLVDIEVKVESVTQNFQFGSDKSTVTSGVYDLRLFRNGQLVEQSTPYERREAFNRAAPELLEKNKLYSQQTKRLTNTPELEAWRAANDLATIKDVTSDSKGQYTYVFRNVRLPRDGSKEVEFTAYAFNADRVKSNRAVKSHTIPESISRSATPGRAYVISFGVNKYESSSWNLKYAAKDARKMREVLSARLNTSKQFSDVVDLALISDDEEINGTKLQKRDATKGNIKTLLELLAGKEPERTRLDTLRKAVGDEDFRKLRQAQPQDAVFLSFSSHGYADRNGIFYLLPTDIGASRQRTVTATLLQNSISSDELSLWLGGIDAGEMVLIVDACNADAAVRNSEFKPAPMGSRGLGQLAYDKGIQILTATQADNVAIESGGAINHGLLTYALLKEGLESAAADFRPKDAKIQLNEWLGYGETRVPRLYEELAAGKLKMSGRDAFEIEVEGQKKEKLTLQRPSLFDFRKGRRQLTIGYAP